MPHFVKYQSLGNDYLIVDPEQVGIAACGENARLICDRRFGVGADGVLFGSVRRGGKGQLTGGEKDRRAAPPGIHGPFGLEIYNSDGSACGSSGNGIRIFALHLAQHRLAVTAPPCTLTIRTSVGPSTVDIVDFVAGIVRIDLGASVVAAPDGRGPLRVGGRDFPVISLELGNPHAVIVLDEVSEKLAYEFGEAIAGHPRFPSRTNVQFVRVISRDVLEVQIWERGAGYTPASGAGACAAVCATSALGLTGDVVSVRMPGGEVQVRLTAAGTVTLTSPVTPVASGWFAPGLLHQLAR